MSNHVAVEPLITRSWDFDDPAASEATFAQLTEDAGETTVAGLVFRTQVARARGLSGDLAGASGILDSVAGDLDAVPTGSDRDHVAARVAIERGRVLNSGGDPAGARPLFDQAHEHAVRAGAAGLAIDALHMIAICVGQTDGFEASARWNERAIDEAEQSTDPEARRWLGSLLNNLAWDRHDAGDAAAALTLFKRALSARQETGHQPELNIARWSVARALLSLERYDEALAIQQALAADPHSADDGYVHEELAECLLALGRPDEAHAWFATARALLSPTCQGPVTP